MPDPIESTAKTVGSAGVQKTLTKPIANVPIGVWVAVIAGSLAFAYMRSKKTAATNAAATQPSSALVYTGTGNGTDPTNTTPTTGNTFQTNEAWAQAAKNYLIGQGVDGKEASDAVDLYVQGQALNAKQNAHMSNVIRAIGAPPQTLPPTTGIPNGGTTGNTWSGNVWGTTPRQNTRSIVGTSYVVQNGDDLVKIAKLAYGLSTDDYSSMAYASNEILNNNHEKINDLSHIAVGTKLYIPVLSSEQFPNFGNKIPQLGLHGRGPFDHSTGEWQIDTGLIPQSANASRNG